MALREGTIPLARRVGAVVDIVIDESDSHRDRANGFLFRKTLRPGPPLDAGAAASARWALELPRAPR